jgi:alkylation response protein AidB-like acyl-CoA dehydrogenase
MATELEAARTVCLARAAALDRKDPDATMLCAMAKRFGTDVGFEVANQACNCTAATAISANTASKDRARSARAPEPEGTNENHAADRVAQS